MKKILSILLLASFFFMGTTAIINAEALAPKETVSPANETFKNPIKYNNFNDLVAAVTETAVKVLMPFVVLAFIYSGFLYVKAQGKDKELTEAKNAILWSVVGAFILFGAWSFAKIISTTVLGITGVK